MIRYTTDDTLEAATFRVTLDGWLYAAGSFQSSSDRDRALWSALQRARHAAGEAPDHAARNAV